MKIPAILLLASVASLTAAPTRFDVEFQRAAITSRIDMFPGDPALFNRPKPVLPVENPADILRRMKQEILGAQAGFAPHPASGFGMKLAWLAKRQSREGFDAVRADYIATFQAMKAWLVANPAP